MAPSGSGFSTGFVPDPNADVGPLDLPGKSRRSNESTKPGPLGQKSEPYNIDGSTVGPLMVSKTRSKSSGTATGSVTPMGIPSLPPYPESGIGEEYVPGFLLQSSMGLTGSSPEDLHKARIGMSQSGIKRREPLAPLTTSSVSYASASGEYLPDMDDNSSSESGEATVRNVTAAAYILASPTLGLSESEWKAIPFSTRRKLKSTMEQVGNAIETVTKSSSSSFDSSMSSVAPVAVARRSSVTESSPLSFTTRKRRERANTMYPELESSGSGSAVLSRSPFENLRRSATALSRSVSVSTSPSASYSPAYQYLSRYGSASGQGSGSSDGYLGEHVGNYVLGKLIGYGAFSQIREALTFEHGQKVVRAVKIVRKYSTSQSAEKMEQVHAEFDHEVTLWKNLDHQNILHLLDVEEDETATYCFTEKISSGTLLDVVREIQAKFKDTGSGDRAAVAKKLLPRTLDYLRQLTSALLYLHQTMHIVHRDFKLENCLLEKQENGHGRILLCDFGMSDYYEPQPEPMIANSDSKMLSAEDNLKGHSSTTSMSSVRSDNSANHLLIGPSDTSSRIHLDEEADRPEVSRPCSNISLSMSSSTTSQNGGSLPYASPQLLESSTPIVSPAADMWAFGVVMYGLLMGKLPWHHGFAPKLRILILETQWDDAEVEKVYGRAIADIVRGCLEVEVENRWDIGTVQEALKHLRLSQ